MANGDLPALMNRIGADAAEAARVLAQAGATEKNASLRAAAGELRARCEEILSGNALDLADARKASASAALLDRLALDRSRIEAMARGLEEIAALPDPVGTRDRGVATPERARDSARARAARRHRHHL